MHDLTMMKKILFHIYIILFTSSISVTVIPSQGGIYCYVLSGGHPAAILVESEQRDILQNPFDSRKWIRVKPRQSMECYRTLYEYFICIAAVLIIRYIHCMAGGAPDVTLQTLNIRMDN